MDVLTNCIVVVISQYICIYQIITLYTLNLYNLFVNYTSIQLQKNQFALGFLLVFGEKLPRLNPVEKVKGDDI